MNRKIAVLSDSEDLPTTLAEAESVIVYVNVQNNWQESTRFSCSDYPKATPQDMRLLGLAIADNLADVRIILGSAIAGVSFSALNRAGFMICEAAAISSELFDYLFDQLNSEQESPAEKYNLLQPAELPGHYFIDLKEAQKRNPLASSKMILRPIFIGTPFVEIILRCDHEPEWFKTELPGHGLEIVRKMTDFNDCLLTIRKVSCAT